ncbi:TatD family hydrolase [Piscinibacter koreensis]|uniref:TatD family hydrolase n=1 Tax=Piscinibacter koreensis TaxID=2742824 RepID=A0A7Y6TYF4_9BURK|nr:TatD family hydrolase [Schlegelella koreensis]NUZ08042.1 TatD family hydrolase [Schlegelella koreensis]
MYVDSHCHLSYPGLADRIDAVRADMAAADVDRALCICTTLEEFEAVHALALAYDNFWCSVGVHPDNEDVQEPTVDDLVSRAARPRVVAIGETGLDYYRLDGRGVDEMAWQRERFRVHIRASLATGLPLVIHTRSASADTLDVLREEGGSRATGVFHCFTETAEVARAALDLGFYISFSGILTFKNAAELREVARFVPLDRCLIETDSPYLAPVPFRGKPNSPAWVPYVARQIAELKGSSPEAIGETTSRNFETLFGRVAANAG